MRAEELRLVVAGTAGGVGTTTVTALLFDALLTSARAAPRLLDHTGGALGARLPEGDEAARVDPRWQLHDLGPHAVPVGVAALADPQAWLVGVTAATPRGCALAEQLVDAVRAGAGDRALRRVVVVLVGVSGRYRLARQQHALEQRALEQAGPVEVVLLPRDEMLAAGGSIPRLRLSRGTRRGMQQLVSALPVGVLDASTPGTAAGARAAAAGRNAGPRP